MSTPLQGEICPCGLPMRSAKQTVRFVQGKSPLFMFEVLLLARWCSRPDCHVSESVEVVKRPDPGSSPWKYSETPEGVIATPYSTGSAQSVTPKSKWAAKVGKHNNDSIMKEVWDNVKKNRESERAEPQGEALAPCRWCGETPLLRDRLIDGRRKDGPRNFYVMCMAQLRVGGCPVRVSTKMCDTPEEAIAAWNTRATPPPTAEALTEEQAAACEAEIRTLETAPEATAMRLLMQSFMPCGHNYGNLLTCPDPPFGCVICLNTRAATVPAADTDIETQYDNPNAAHCKSAEKYFTYIFAVWPDETWGRSDLGDAHKAIPPAVFQLLKGYTMQEMNFTALEFVRFRLDVESFGLTLREVSRVPYYEPEVVL